MTRLPGYLILGSIGLAMGAGCTKSPTAATAGSSGQTTTLETLENPETKKTILENVLKLIRDAPTNPGGNNFDIATENLNDYFLDAKPTDYQLPEPTVGFLGSQELFRSIPGALESIAERRFLQNDGRHIEDNLLYYSVATRAAGEGDDLTRVRRLFDWVVRQITLVPARSLVPAGVKPAQARPYDVLLRGMAVEESGGWSERGWLFLVLLRQLGIDAGVVMYSPRVGGGPLAKGPGITPPRRESKFWCICALIDGKPYLFDTQVGLPIPTADGRGVATLEQACTDPGVLARMDLTGIGYEPSMSELAAHPVKILLESSFGTLSPRMRLLQRDLAGKNRMSIFRDPVEQVDAFQKAIGDRCGSVELWPLPLAVEYNLFHDSEFVRATQYALQFFDGRFPLLGTRLNQLRGDLPTAMQGYVSFRFAEDALETDGKTTIPAGVQQGLDAFATYFLALAQLDKGDASQARFLFKETLRLLPDPAQASPYYSMFRWGAATNLGLLHADAGETSDAIRYLTMPIPTAQGLGNLLRCRELVWKAPFAEPSATKP